MKQITREWLAFLREQYPVGSRIRLNSMEDPYAPVEPGTMGTLQRIDDAGQFLMKWDNGRTLSLIPGEDSFSLILPEPTMMKLYMPLHADLYTKDDWSDTSEEPEMLTGRALMEYEDSILIALIKNRMSEEAERGIMRWYVDMKGTASAKSSGVCSNWSNAFATNVCLKQWRHGPRSYFRTRSKSMPQSCRRCPILFRAHSAE